MLYPFKFTPVYKDYIWGGRNLQKFGKALPEGNVAESWEISCHPDGKSIICNGEFSGLTLDEIIKKCGRDIIGSELEEKYLKKFPLLIKLIDANDKLSVQVHPGDEYAQIFENGELGKNEMWHIISAKPGSKLCYDVMPGVTKEVFKKAIEENEVDKCLKFIEVKKGDTINIPEGLIHAIGEGIVLAEVQQNSNTTYRVFDYNRVDKAGNSRPLHIEKALNVIDFNSEGRKEIIDGLSVNITENSKVTYKIANKYFAVELYDVEEPLSEYADGERFCIYIIIEGTAHINYPNGSMNASFGESVFIPASLGHYYLSGNFKALKTYVPDMNKNVLEPLKKAGYSMEEIQNNISLTM